MPLKGLDHVNMSVTSFDDTVDWYGRVFGFKLVEEDVKEGVRWGVIRQGETMLCIYENPSFRYLNKEQRAERKIHGVSHFGLRMTDEAEWLKTIEREKLHVGYAGAVRWPHSTAYYVYDPTGNEIEAAFWDDDAIAFD